MPLHSSCSHAQTAILCRYERVHPYDPTVPAPGLTHQTVKKKNCIHSGAFCRICRFNVDITLSCSVTAACRRAAGCDSQVSCRGSSVRANQPAVCSGQAGPCTLKRVRLALGHGLQGQNTNERRWSLWWAATAVRS